jgi:hypothetical protein
VKGKNKIAKYDSEELAIYDNKQIANIQNKHLNKSCDTEQFNIVKVLVTEIKEGK